MPTEQSRGYLQMFEDLEKDLCEITGFDGISLQPNRYKITICVKYQYIKLSLPVECKLTLSCWYVNYVSTLCGLLLAFTNMKVAASEV